jgi:hypothetical protein
MCNKPKHRCAFIKDAQVNYMKHVNKYICNFLPTQIPTLPSPAIVGHATCACSNFDNHTLLAKTLLVVLGERIDAGLTNEKPKLPNEESIETLPALEDGKESTEWFNLIIQEVRV